MPAPRVEAAERAPSAPGYAGAERYAGLPASDKPALAKSPPAASTAPAEVTTGPATGRDDSYAYTPAKPERPASREEPPARYSRNIQSGTLTAGSFDDHERLDAYREFLSGSMQNDAGEALPRITIGQRAVIRVTTAQGKPVADARVVVRPSGQERGQEQPATLLDVTTGSDGRAVFLSGMDGAGGGQKCDVTVTPPDGTPPLSQTMGLDQPNWEFRLPSAKEKRPERLDLALVVDTTGSMGDELEYLKVEIDSIAETVHRMFPKVDQRYALVVYRDQGDEYVVRTYDFSSSLAEFRQTLAGQRASGGGDYPEAVHAAFEQAVKLSWRTEDTARVMFWVADAPPHREFYGRTMGLVGDLRRKTVRMYPVAGSGVGREAEFIMRVAAFLTQGQYLFLTDHSGVGNPHEAPHVPDYVVERLDRLMIRMIASELAGRKLAADEIIAIEGGRSPYDPSTPIPPGQQQGSIHGNRPPVARTSQHASWFSLAWPSGWRPHWALLAMVLVGKVVLDVVSERRQS